MLHLALRVGFFLIGICSLLAFPAKGEESDFSYEEGPVWLITQVQTKPGKFDEYIEDLSGHWRSRKQFQMEKGDVLSYKIMYLPWARDDEPGLLLMTEYRDFSAFDREAQYWREMTEASEGSVETASRAFAERSELRTFRGSFVAREILLLNGPAEP